MASLARIFRCRNSLKKLLTMTSSPISSSSRVMEKVVEELHGNPFFDKYADKIAQLQQCQPEELKARIEKHEESKKPNFSNREMWERPFSSAPQTAKPNIEANPFTKPKKLDDVMKTELLKDKSADEIKHLWLDFHKDKDVIVGVLPKDTYSIMHKRGIEFSTFVFPVPRSQGYEFIMCQIVSHEVHFTPLIAYQTHKENAPECLTMTFYADLQDDKGVVLMKGEYDTDILNCQEVQCLANELQLYYAQDNPKRLKLLERFTYAPSEFNHMDLIAELECLSL